MWIVVALLFVFLVPVIAYVSYGTLLWFLPRSMNGNFQRLHLSRDEPPHDVHSVPKVSLVFPTYNEDKVIARKMENVFSLDYPRDKLEIIVVDDASTDKTVELLEKLARENVKIIRHNARKGYNQAMITGTKCASGDIIALTDAGALQDQKALKILVKHFADPMTGGVTGRQVILNWKEGIGPKFEKDYSKFYNFMRKREAVLDSTFEAKGEISAFKREIVENVFDLRLNDRGTFDLYLGYLARIIGFKVIYDEDAVFYEYAPRSMKEWFRQKVNRAIITLDTMSMFRTAIFNKRFGLFGLLILPFRFLISFVSPSLLCTGFVLAAYASFLIPAVLLNFWIGLLIATLALSLSVSRYFVLTFSLSQLALTLGLLRIILGGKKSRILWTQIPSTRGSHV